MAYLRNDKPQIPLDISLKPLENIRTGLPETIAEEASRLVNGVRNADYGHPLDDFSKTAKIWSAILGIEVTPEQVALCMVGVKISRQVNANKRDNLVDAIGYFLTLDMVIQERLRREGMQAK